MATTDALDAIETIKQLKARYFRLLDTKDWAGFRNVFADEITVDVESGGGPRDTTADAFVDRVAARLDGTITVHHGHMPEIHLTSAVTATGVWSMEDKIWWPPESPVRFMHGYGHYHETYTVTERGWRISAMRLTRVHQEFDPPVGTE